MQAELLTWYRITGLLFVPTYVGTKFNGGKKVYEQNMNMNKIDLTVQDVHYIF